MAVVGAALAPCCFPVLAAGLGLVGIAGWETGSRWITQGSAVLTLVALWRARRGFGGIFSLLVGVTGAGLIFVAYHATFFASLVYEGLSLLICGAVGLWVYRRLRWDLKQPILRSVLTCPACGFRKSETMPTHACLFFWDCPKCGARARPLAGDCCVFCSYGTAPCPPVQLRGCAC
ncbi:MAG: hypothetical protein OHK005_03730 [Candidatus Methylacidiphilales bacterium]